MKVLVIGASTKPNRISYQAIEMLKEEGHDILAIGARAGQVHDIWIRPHLIQADDVDTVTLYIRPELQQEYMDYIVALQPRRVIFNPGTEHPAFAELLAEHDIIADHACTLVLLRTGQF